MCVFVQIPGILPTCRYHWHRCLRSRSQLAFQTSPNLNTTYLGTIHETKVRLAMLFFKLVSSLNQLYYHHYEVFPPCYHPILSHLPPELRMSQQLAVTQRTVTHSHISRTCMNNNFANTNGNATPNDTKATRQAHSRARAHTPTWTHVHSLNHETKIPIHK